MPKSSRFTRPSVVGRLQIAVHQILVVRRGHGIRHCRGQLHDAWRGHASARNTSIFSNRSTDPPQERARYAGAILDLLGSNEPLTVLRQTPAAIVRTIDDLTHVQLRTPEGPGSWSIVQVLQHLADSDLVWGWRCD